VEMELDALEARGMLAWNMDHTDPDTFTIKAGPGKELKRWCVLCWGSRLPAAHLQASRTRMLPLRCSFQKRDEHRVVGLRCDVDAGANCWWGDDDLTIRCYCSTFR
jgi:hypothetical protein